MHMFRTYFTCTKGLTVMQRLQNNHTTPPHTPILSRTLMLMFRDEIFEHQFTLPQHVQLAHTSDWSCSSCTSSRTLVSGSPLHLLCTNCSNLSSTASAGPIWIPQATTHNSTKAAQAFEEQRAPQPLYQLTCNTIDKRCVSSSAHE